MRRQLLTFCIIYFVFCSGCSHFSDTQELNNDLATQTEILLRQHNPQQANREHGANSSQSQKHLQTAIALMKSNKAKEAEQHLNAINFYALEPEELFSVNLVYAQINLSYAKPELALQHLELVEPQQLSPEDKIAYFQSRAFGLSLTKRFIDSAKARIELQNLLSQKQQQLDNKVAILDTLRLLPAQVIESQQSLNSGNTTGWLALAGLFKASPYLAGNDPRLTDWRNHYPKHPANTEFLKYYLAAQQKLLPSIAIFLPNSGSFAEAGKAIEKGISAAFEQTPANTVKPKLRFYDSSSTDPVSLYHKAINDGAQLIVGPLNKEHVEVLAQQTDLKVPVLTLNHVPGLNKPNLYQFALSPLDDVETVAQKAINDGHKRLLLLTPTTELGTRIQGYFRNALQNQDAKIVKQASYNPDDKDFSKPLQELFNQNESEQRYQQLKKLMPGLRSTPRSRKDVDAVLLMAYPPQAKAIQSQLHKMTDSNPPIYATAHIYNGVYSAGDTDLDGIKFCDIPWLFNTAYPGALSQESLRPRWQNLPNIYLRLIAMGIDAYNLIPHLNQLNNIPYQGATGKLLIGADNRIQRELVCAQFEHQKPQLLDFTR